MQRRSYIAVATAAIAACATLVVGCGSGADTDTGPAATSNPGQTTTGQMSGRERTYADPVGDVTPGEPDLRSVTLSNDATTVRFRVRFAHAPPLAMDAAAGWADMLLIGIDVPPIGPPPANGQWRAVDYVMGLHGPDTQVRFRAMNAGGPERRRVQASITGPVISFPVPRAWLGSPTRFTFNVAAGREGGASGDGGDVMPATDVFTYVMR